MDAEDYRDRRDAQQERRAARLPIRQAEIEALSELGYDVKKMNDGYAYRVNRVYDLYTIHNRWHHLKTQKRGSAKNLADFIKIQLPIKD
jgi:hypothetical protein